jgi:hypothetical protein
VQGAQATVDDDPFGPKVSSEQSASDATSLSNALADPREWTVADGTVSSQTPTDDERWRSGSGHVDIFRAEAGPAVSTIPSGR